MISGYPFTILAKRKLRAARGSGNYLPDVLWPAAAERQPRARSARRGCRNVRQVITGLRGSSGKGRVSPRQIWICDMIQKLYIYQIYDYDSRGGPPRLVECKLITNLSSQHDCISRSLAYSDGDERGVLSEYPAARLTGLTLSHVVTQRRSRAAPPPRFAWQAPRRAAASRQQGLTMLGKFDKPTSPWVQCAHAFLISGIARRLVAHFS